MDETGAVCVEPGCDAPATVMRPSRQPYVLQPEEGDPVVIPEGDADEGVCADHA